MRHDGHRAPLHRRQHGLEIGLIGEYQAALGVVYEPPDRRRRQRRQRNPDGSDPQRPQQRKHPVRTVVHEDADAVAGFNSVNCQASRHAQGFLLGLAVGIRVNVARMIECKREAVRLGLGPLVEAVQKPRVGQRKYWLSCDFSAHR